MDADLSELLKASTIALQRTGEDHEVSIQAASREEAEAIMEALERIADGR